LHAHASSSTVAQVPGPAQVEANARYIESRPRDSLARGAIGVRASFCADDDLLRVAGQAKERLTVGAHLGLAENDDDLALTWSNTNSRIVTRFERFGLLGGASVGAFARVINRSEAMRLAQSRTLIALTPGVSQASHGGTAPGLDTMTHQNLIGLGTAGTGTLWEELTASFTSIMAMARAGRMLDPDALIASFLVSGPAELCTMVYGAPSGSVDVGALADLVVYDFVPSEENQNCPAHFLLRLSMMPVAWNIVDGRVRVREGRLVGADEAALALESARALQSVWKRAGVG
jgi:5-methylthioadenosine/S-adenosylhomocysteine deaminase